MRAQGQGDGAHLLLADCALSPFGRHEGHGGRVAGEQGQLDDLEEIPVYHVDEFAKLPVPTTNWPVVETPKAALSTMPVILTPPLASSVLRSCMPAVEVQ